MRVVLLSFWFIEYTIQLANALSKKINVILMLPRSHTQSYLSMINNGVDVQLFKNYRLRYPTNTLTVYKIIKQINDFNPDVIHIQSGYPWIFFGLPFIRRYPVVATIHDPKPHVGSEMIPIVNFTAYTTRKFTSQMIVHGINLKHQMMELYDLPSERIHVVPIGNFSILKKWKDDIKEETNSILFFGSLRKGKGLNYLIKAMSFITEKVPNTRLIIAGSGNFKEYGYLIKNEKNFEIRNHYIPNEEIAELFQKAAVIVLPYIEASQSAVVPLAFTFGKPVIVTNVGSIPEVVDDGKTGFIVPPKDVEKLAEAIIKILKNDKLRKKMGENAYNKAKEELSWDKIAEKTIKVYEKTIESRRKK